MGGQIQSEVCALPVLVSTIPFSVEQPVERESVHLRLRVLRHNGW
jgi:hypothetical protein